MLTCRYQNQLWLVGIQCWAHHPVKGCPVGAAARPWGQRHIERVACAWTLANFVHHPCSTINLLTYLITYMQAWWIVVWE